MSILQDDISKTYLVCKDGEVLASFEKVADAKKYWADYQAGKAKKPKGNDIEATKKATKEPAKKVKEVKAPAVKKKVLKKSKKN